jgi:hypothetical protein
MTRVPSWRDTVFSQAVCDDTPYRWQFFLSDEHMARALDMWSRGLGTYDIANGLNVSESAVFNHLRAYREWHRGNR